MNVEIKMPQGGRWVLPTAVFVILLMAGWLYWTPPDEEAGQVVAATESKEVKTVPKVDVPIASGKVQVYKGGTKLKEKLTLPQPVVEDDKQVVLASSKVPAGERPHTVTTVINTETGKSETYVRTDPLPWLAYESRGEFGAYYGVKAGQPTVRLQARQDILQVKALHLGVTGSVDIGNTKPDYFVGVGISYRW